MLHRLLPRTADNGYQGHRLALWLLGAALVVHTAIGVNSIVNGFEVARTADGIPLDTYPAGAAATVVSLFGLLGVARVTLGALGFLVLLRYRSLVPLALALLLMEHLGKRVVLSVLPIPREGAPPAATISDAILATLVLGLALSLWRRGGGAGGATAPPGAG